MRFVRAALCYWLLVYPRVRAELRRLRRCALEIEDPGCRGLALAALSKRANVEGAAAFAAFVPRRERAHAIRALACFQAVYNYADLLAEQRSHPDPVECARRLHLSLLDALGDDDAHAANNAPGGGIGPCLGAPADDLFLVELAGACRAELRGLPSYELVAPLACRAARRIVAFQSLSVGCEGELEHWAGPAPHTAPAPAAGPAHDGADGVAARAELAWWETAAAAGSSLAVNALIAAACSPTLTERDAAAIDAAYFPAIGALHSLLDSLVDQAEDAVTGQLSLIRCYASPAAAADRLVRLAGEARAAAAALPRPSAHVILVAAMACSYLDEARAAAGAPTVEIDLDALARRMTRALGPSAAAAMLVFGLRRSLRRASRRGPGRASAPGARPQPPAPAAAGPEPEGADARAA